MGGEELGGMALGGAGGAGRREEDVTSIISKIGPPDFDTPQEGFTANFEIDEPPTPITLDDDGRVIHNPSRKIKKKPYLACANCSEPLLISSAYRAPADRVWALRCGHMIDQRCLDTLSTPKTEAELATVQRHPPGDLPILRDDAIPVKRPRGKRAKVHRRTLAPPLTEYEWRCSVEGCGRAHWSVRVGDGWSPKEGLGALSLYA